MSGIAGYGQYCGKMHAAARPPTTQRAVAPAPKDDQAMQGRVNCDDGDKMILMHHGRDGGMMNPRSCGDCTLCCKLLSITELEKPIGKWCPHCEIGKGCKIYDCRPQS